MRVRGVPELRNLFLGAIAGAAVLGLTGQAAAAGFSNGSFESPGIAGVRQQITPGMVPSWTYLAGHEPRASYDFYESGGQGGLIAADGAHYVSFGHNGTHGGSIYQDFHTVIGTTYTVTYLVAEQEWHDPSQKLRAVVSNGSQVLWRDNTPLSKSFAAGVPITFTARTDLTRVTFSDATPAGGGAISNLALDAVAINGSAAPASGDAPEPAAWLLMLLGVAGVGAVMRSRGWGISPVN